MKTLFVGQTLLEFPELKSTNDSLREHLSSEKLPEGTVVRALDQTAGRGQRGNRWNSEPGKNLTFSVVLYPALHAGKQSLLVKFVSLAIVEFVSGKMKERNSPGEVMIKWPNDVLVSGKKISGILIENAVRDEYLVSSIIGIGININQNRFSDLPDATSLSLVCSRAFDLNACLAELCSLLEYRYLQLKADKALLLEEEYDQWLIR